VKGKFVLAKTAERDQLDWGEIGWMSRPPTTGAKNLAVLEVTLNPGHGHDFHKHPDQEEVIYVMEGEIEQWIEQDKQVLQPGDTVFIQANVVHASFTQGDKPAKLLAILGPCVGEGGYEMVDVSDQAPWNSLK
jgi:quercetin dioxygenase-like cupin family protein